LREAPQVENRAELDEIIAMCNRPQPPPPAAATTTPAPPGMSSSVGDAPVDRGRDKRTLGWIVAGAGLAVTATGIVFAFHAGSIAHEVAAYRGPWDAAAQDLDARGSHFGVLATALLGVGVASIAGGGVLWYLGDRERRVEAHPIAVT